MTEERPLLDWLRQRFPDTPRTRAKQWILAGRVTVGGVPMRQPHYRLPDPGGALQLLPRRAVTLDCGPRGLPVDARLRLLHLDAAVAVVNKAAGLLAVPAQPEDVSALGLLTEFLRGPRPGRLPLPAVYRQLQPLPVHRLDQYTSGVFCLATHPEARASLIRQLRARTFCREYLAWVEGRLSARRGTWRHWLKLSADQLRQTVVAATAAGATEAVAHYEVVEEWAGGVTKLRVRLESGCKHQIRVQAAAAGLPLVGDRLYNPRRRIAFERQALHAVSLTFEHPQQGGRRLTFTAELPGDLRQLEETLRGR